jgi:hypothetical protein
MKSRTVITEVTSTITEAQHQATATTTSSAADLDMLSELLRKVHLELCSAIGEQHDMQLNNTLRGAMQSELSLRRNRNVEASPAEKVQDAAADDDTLARVRVVERLERDLQDRQGRLEERERLVAERESAVAAAQEQRLGRMQSNQGTASEASHGGRRKTPTISPTRRAVQPPDPLVSTTKEKLKKEIEAIEEKKAALRSRLLEVQNASGSSAPNSRKSSAAAGGSRTGSAHRYVSPMQRSASAVSSSAPGGSRGVSPTVRAPPGSLLKSPAQLAAAANARPGVTSPMKRVTGVASSTPRVPQHQQGSSMLGGSGLKETPMMRRSPVGRVPSPTVGLRSTPVQRTPTPQNRPPSVTRRPLVSQIAVPAGGSASRPQSADRRTATAAPAPSTTTPSGSARAGVSSARQPLSGRSSSELNNPRPGSGRLQQSSPGRLPSSRSVSSANGGSVTTIVERKSALLSEPTTDVVMRHLGVYMSKALEVLESTTSMGLPIRTNTGLVGGDMILECNGFALTSLEHLKQVLTAYDGAEPILLTLLRGSAMINLSIDHNKPQEA